MAKLILFSPDVADQQCLICHSIPLQVRVPSPSKCSNVLCCWFILNINKVALLLLFLLLLLLNFPPPHHLAFSCCSCAFPEPSAAILTGLREEYHSIPGIQLKKTTFFSTALLKNAPYCFKHRYRWLEWRIVSCIFIHYFSPSHLTAGIAPFSSSLYKARKQRMKSFNCRLSGSFPLRPWSSDCSKSRILCDHSETCAHPFTAQQHMVKLSSPRSLALLCCICSAQAVFMYSSFPCWICGSPHSAQFWFYLERH